MYNIHSLKEHENKYTVTNTSQNTYIIAVYNPQKEKQTHTHTLTLQFFAVTGNNTQAKKTG